MAKAGKKYRNAFAKVDSEKNYEMSNAFELLKEINYVKFDPTVDLVVNLGIDPRHADQALRGAVSLPHGLGKKVRIVVFAKGDKFTEAKEAGADEVGADELAQKISGGWFEFDQVVATPDMMAVVGKLGKVLGPRGLMPNPKLGTDTFDVGKAIKELKAGRAEYRAEKAGIVHTAIGKLSFTPQQLAENAEAVMDSIVRAKPSTAKGTYVKKLTVSSTMSPGVKVDVAKYRI